MSIVTKFVWEIHHPLLSKLVSLWKQTIFECNTLITQESTISQLKSTFKQILQSFNAELIQISEDFSTLCASSPNSTVFYSHVSNEQFHVTKDDMTDHLLQLVSYKAVFQLLSILYLDFHENISNPLLYWFHSYYPIPQAYDQYISSIQNNIPLKIGSEFGSLPYWKTIDALVLSGRIPEFAMLLQCHKVTLQELTVHSYNMNCYDLLLAIILSCPSYQSENLTILRDTYGFPQSLSRFLQDRRLEEAARQRTRILAQSGSKRRTHHTAAAVDEQIHLPTVDHDDTCFDELSLEHFTAWQSLVKDILQDITSAQKGKDELQSSDDIAAFLNLLRLLSGDLEFLTQKCWNWMQLFFARLLYIDPFLTREEVFQLYLLCHETYVTLSDLSDDMGDSAGEGSGSLDHHKDHSQRRSGVTHDAQHSTTPVEDDQNTWKVYYDRDTQVLKEKHGFSHRHDDDQSTASGHSVLDTAVKGHGYHAHSHHHQQQQHPFTDRPVPVDTPLVFVVLSAIQPILYIMMTLDYSSTLPALYAFYSHSLFNSIISIFFSLRIGISTHIDTSLPLVEQHKTRQQQQRLANQSSQASLVTHIDTDDNDLDVDQLLDLLAPPTRMQPFPLIDFEDHDSDVVAFTQSFPSTDFLVSHADRLGLLFFRHFNTTEKWFYTCVEEYVFQFRQYAVYFTPIDDDTANATLSTSDQSIEDAGIGLGAPQVGQHLNNQVALQRYQYLLQYYMKSQLFLHQYEQIIALFTLDLFPVVENLSPHEIHPLINHSTAPVLPHPIDAMNQVLSLLQPTPAALAALLSYHSKPSSSRLPLWKYHAYYPTTLSQLKQHLFFSTIAISVSRFPDSLVPTLCDSLISFDCQFQYYQLCLSAILCHWTPLLFDDHPHIMTQLRILCDRYSVPPPSDTKDHHSPRLPSLEKVLLWAFRLKDSHFILSLLNICLTYAYSDNISLSTFVRGKLHLFWVLQRSYWPCLPSDSSLDPIPLQDSSQQSHNERRNVEDMSSSSSSQTMPGSLLTCASESIPFCAIGADLLSSHERFSLQMIEQFLHDVGSNSNPIDTNHQQPPPRSPAPVVLNDESFIHIMALFDLLWVVQKKLQTLHHRYTLIHSELVEVVAAQLRNSTKGTNLSMMSSFAFDQDSMLLSTSSLFHTTAISSAGGEFSDLGDNPLSHTQQLRTILGTHLSPSDIHQLEQFRPLVQLAWLLCDTLLAASPFRLYKLVIAETLCVIQSVTGSIPVLSNILAHFDPHTAHLEALLLPLHNETFQIQPSLVYRLEHAFYQIYSQQSTHLYRFFVLPNIISSQLCLPKTILLPSSPDPEDLLRLTRDEPRPSDLHKNRLNVFFNPINSHHELGSTILDTSLCLPIIQSTLSSQHTTLTNQPPFEKLKVVVEHTSIPNLVSNHQANGSFHKNDNSASTPSMLSLIDRVNLEENIIAQNISAMISTHFQSSKRFSSFPLTYGSS